MTTAQLREPLIQAGQHHPGDPDILIVVDAGYDVPRLAFLPADLPVEILRRMRSDRALRRPARASGHQRHGSDSQTRERGPRINSETLVTCNILVGRSRVGSAWG